MKDALQWIYAAFSAHDVAVVVPDEKGAMDAALAYFHLAYIPGELLEYMYHTPTLLRVSSQPTAFEIKLYTKLLEAQGYRTNSASQDMDKLAVAMAMANTRFPVLPQWCVVAVYAITTALLWFSLQPSRYIPPWLRSVVLDVHWWLAWVHLALIALVSAGSV